MKYTSTRGNSGELSSTQAIIKGLAPDGGLFVPKEVPSITLEEIKALMNCDYNERAYSVLKKFLTDYTEEELRKCIDNAYSKDKFSSDKIVPLVSTGGDYNFLELWHGPTSAFKDMALQILPQFLVTAIHKNGEDNEIVILVATSGDTGKAALDGFSNVEGTRVVVFYPNNGVSEVQRLQMITQEGNNVASIALKGNFDDCQTGVKELFCDDGIISDMKAKDMQFSSANSINLGRLVPQVVYYFSSYVNMISKGKLEFGDKINFVVPTGNFGNILAAWYAKTMGLPVNKLICASNDNNVLTEFIKTGAYDTNRDFFTTVSPSMDILISSNLERLLFEISGRDSEKINTWMSNLKDKGIYRLDEGTMKNIKAEFWGDYATEADTIQAISDVYKKQGYLIDTHTAVGVDVYDKYKKETKDTTPTVIVSTASPFKFNKAVAKAVLGDYANYDNEFELLDVLSEATKVAIPEGLKDLDKKEILHKEFCEIDGMKLVVKKVLGI